MRKNEISSDNRPTSFNCPSCREALKKSVFINPLNTKFGTCQNCSNILRIHFKKYREPTRIIGFLIVTVVFGGSSLIDFFLPGLSRGSYFLIIVPFLICARLFSKFELDPSLYVEKVEKVAPYKASRVLSIKAFWISSIKFIMPLMIYTMIISMPTHYFSNLENFFKFTGVGVLTSLFISLLVIPAYFHEKGLKRGEK